MNCALLDSIISVALRILCDFLKRLLFFSEGKFQRNVKFEERADVAEVRQMYMVSMFPTTARRNSGIFTRVILWMQCVKE